MINQRYKMAMMELLEYLKGIEQEDIDKIPKKLMNFFEENALKEYICKFDYNKPLKEMKLLDETRGLISMICLNYWCETEEQKQRYLERLNKNERKYQEELREKYNPDNIFQKNQVADEAIKENTELIEYQEQNILTKIIHQVKEFLLKFIRKL